MSETIPNNLKRSCDPAQSSPIIKKICKIDDNLQGRTRVFRKCAIIVVYSGWGYFGMQRNEGFKTIEGDLLSAFRKAGYISHEQESTPQLINFQRASKTDKSVSAAGQVSSAKLPIDGLSVEQINAHLPDQIKILDIFRVTKGFHPKTACNHRVYQYLLPTFAFAPRNTITRQNCWQYRLPADGVNRVNVLFNRYKGTRNYFNFTSKRAPNDKSCIRYIMSMECGSPFLLGGDKEFAMITVKGQSFMLHQIRKMIGLLIAIVSGHATEAIFDNVFKTERVNVPRAPGLGLLLDYVDFSRYNKRFCTDKVHTPIDWTRYKDEIEEFKRTYIFKHMLEREVADNSMLEWLSTLEYHTFDFPREDYSPADIEEKQPLLTTTALPVVSPAAESADVEATSTTSGAVLSIPHTAP